MDRQLIGGRCTGCGALMYPAPEACPACLNDKIDHAELASTGRVRTSAVINLGRAGFPIPYFVAWVDLDDGVRVFGRADRELAVGAPASVHAGEDGLPRFGMAP